MLSALASVPRYPCAQLPTPVQRLAELGRALGIPELWIKRDDLSGTLYGGNKIRKLSFLLGQALEEKRHRIVTAGAIGSHHSLATTLYGRRAGLEVEAALFPQPPTDHVKANLAANLGAGAHPIPLRSPIEVPFVLALRSRRSGAMLIPGGGSSPRGAIGYVEAALELAEQVRTGELPEPDLAIVPLGTGGTAAGLELGLRLAGLRTRLLAVRVIDRIIGNATTVVRLAHRIQKEMHRFDPALPWVRVGRCDVEHRQFGGRYGEATPAAIDAAHQARALEGIELETTYTAKALAAIVCRAREGSLPNGPILFWNTFSSVRPPGYDPTGAAIRHLLPPQWKHIFDDENMWDD
ncbi:MAG: 1-aminocyclopropane-1-carboxylate deaminase [Gemmatimonadetes bacterium]|nr:1-aminocyclopropane-1-carboxylate deaminase [Gemmatimonadota bacterium]